MKKQLLSAASIASIAFAGLAFAAPAQAAVCADPVLFVNTETELIQYNEAGTQVGPTVTFENGYGYGDIGITQDLTTVYGVFNEDAWPDPQVDPGNNTPNGDVIEVVNASTGAVTSTILITGTAAGVGNWVGAAMLPSGELVIGNDVNPKVYKVNLTTGASTEWVDMSTANGNITSTMGDFARLPDGDEIAIGDNEGVAYVVRIHEDGTQTVAGMIPDAWGAGRVGNTLMVAGDAMYVIKLSDIPASGTSEITSVQLNDFSAAYGAAGSQDATTGSCEAALPNTGVDGVALGSLAVGLGLAGAAGLVIARRKRA